MRSRLVLKGLVVGLLVVGSATAADAPKITVSNVDKIVTADFLGDKPVKFAPATQVGNVGILAAR